MSRFYTVIAVCVCMALALVIHSCGGGATMQQKVEQAGITELPPFPGGQVPGNSAKASSAYSNPQFGKNASSKAALGADVQIDSLRMSSSATRFSWAIWSWGAFNTGVVPIDITLELQPVGTNRFWLLFSNYDTGAWEIQGPLDGSVTTFTFDPAVDYVSPSHYTHIAVIAAGGNLITVDRLTLTCEQDFVAPAAPRNLSWLQIEPRQVHLSWLANLEPDLNGYNAYSGPANNFALTDAGVQLMGTAAGGLTSTWVTGLTPETKYYFRLTAFDTAGNESGPSNTLTFTTPVEPVYPAPTNVHTTAIGGYWTDVAWDNVTTPSPLGWEVYTGLAADFQIGDADVVKRNTGLVNAQNYRITGLTSGVTYFCKVRTLYGGWSPLSDAVEFTTIDGAPPTPNFTYDQNGTSYYQTGMAMSFDPSTTTDPDTPMDELVFNWDFDNNGITDKSTTGPSVVFHTYSPRGLYTCKLTVTDGTPVSISKDIVISYRFKSDTVGTGMTSTESVTAIATRPHDSRIALLLSTNAILYFDGSAWSRISLSSLGDITVGDVALSPTGLNVVVTSIEFISGTIFHVNWTIYEYSGGTWNPLDTDFVVANMYDNVDLYYAPNGHYSIAMIGGKLAVPSVIKTLYVWHQQAGGALTENSVGLGNNVYAAVSTLRNDTTSYFVYSMNSNLRLWTYTDSSNSDTVQQATAAGSAQLLAANFDPADDTKVFWLASSGGATLYYGDNFGAANAAGQTYTPASAPTGILGSKLLGDNAAEFYWTAGPGNDFQSIQGYNSSSSTLFTVDSGLGAAKGGVGAPYSFDTFNQMYFAIQEQRDAECTGYRVDDQTIVTKETLTPPYGDGDILDKHAVVVFDDDSFVALAKQYFPSAHAAFAGIAGGSYTIAQAGMDAACAPHSACRTSVAGEYFTASYPYGADLTIDRLNKTSGVALQEDTFTGTALAELQYQPALGQSRLFYAANGPNDIYYRAWDGANWGAAQQIYTGSDTILALATAAAPGGEWAVLFLDDADQLQLIESSGGTFAAPTVLSTEAANGLAGVAIDYDATGNTVVAYERQGASAGVYAGLRAAGFSFTFSLAAMTDGTQVRSMHAVMYNGSPSVVYYQIEPVVDMSRVHVAEPGGGSWASVALPMQLHGDPLGFASDSQGNLIISGRELIASPYDAVVAVLFQN
jgi:hypothetical protein